MNRILIVDDDKDLLISLKNVLTKKGYEVTTTTSCSDALPLLSSISPEIVLLDINAGDEDGRTLCKQIKSQAELQHIPVILISANHEELKRYKDYGANEFVPKPFDLPTLVDKIANTLAT